MKALIRVQTKYRPISGDVQGYRLQACIPNKAARKMKKTSKGFAATDEEVPSFRKPYLILEGSDYAAPPSDTDLERFKKQLAWEGFTEYEFLETAKKDEPKLDAETKRKLDAILAGVGDAPF